jgi:hypothetical protein
LLVALVGVLMLSNCRQDTDDFLVTSITTRPIRTFDSTFWHQYPPSNALVNQLIDELETPTTTLTVNLPVVPITGQSIELRTSENVLISIPVNSLRIAGTTNPPTGLVTFKARSCVKKGDFVRNSMPTMASGRMLVSGGSVQVLATQNGRPLALSGNTMRIRVPATSPSTSMRLFIAGDSSARNVNWFSLDTSANRISVTTWIDSVQQPALVNGYQFFADFFRWVNCDYFWNRTPIGRACVKMDTLRFHPHNTQVFAVFRNENAVSRLSSSAAEHMWCTQQMPLNEPVTYVTISKIDNVYYLGKQTFSNGISASPVTFITPLQSTLPEIVAYLATL